MKIFALLITGIFMILTSVTSAENQFQKDTIKTSGGDLIITFIKHASLMFEYKGMIIYADPVSMFADYSKMPKADIILITHEHGDHFDPKTINLLKKKGTDIILTRTCEEILKEGTVMQNGDKKTVKGLEIKAVPAYNIVHKRTNGQPFHPKGVGNGYVIKFGDKKVYIAGDTEDIPEMKNLKDIYIAFLPMNLPYTMTPEMVAHAADMFKPKILYPYHFGDTDTNILLKLMKDRKYCEVRIRSMN